MFLREISREIWRDEQKISLFCEQTTKQKLLHSYDLLERIDSRAGKYHFVSKSHKIMLTIGLKEKGETQRLKSGSKKKVSNVW